MYLADNRSQVIVDYETECKRCGKCCSPGFLFKNEWVRAKNIRCIYLNDDNLCTVYPVRKQLMPLCQSPYDLTEDVRPEGCAFGGVIREISGEEQEELGKNPPEIMWEIALTNLFRWR